MLKILPVISVSPDYIPVMVWAEEFERFWRKDKGLFVSQWLGAPRDRWFNIGKDNQKTAFLGGLVSVSLGHVGFTNGRHRTRWLLESGMTSLPICIPPEEISDWELLGVLAKNYRETYLNLEFCKWK